MSEYLIELLNMLNSEQLITSDMFNDLDLDGALDERDSEVFDEPWVSASDEIESEFENTVCDESVVNNISLLQEASFKKVYELTGNGEVASYISDDFELFGKAVVIDYKNNWLSAVFEKYCSGIFPAGEIQISNKSINDVIQIQR